MKLLKENFGAYSSGESYEEEIKRKGNKRTRGLEDQFRKPSIWIRKFQRKRTDNRKKTIHRIARSGGREGLAPKAHTRNMDLCQDTV